MYRVAGDDLRSDIYEMKRQNKIRYYMIMGGIQG